jgi:hypothetical protein
MPKALTSIRSLARSHTRTAIAVLVKVMKSEDATPAARVSAANAILDRGWGKAAQPLEGTDGGSLKIIHRIERIIVHPEDTYSEGLRAIAPTSAVQSGVRGKRLGKIAGL